MGQSRESISLHGREIRYRRESGNRIVLDADAWDDDALFEQPWDLQLGEAPPYQHAPKNPEAMADYLDASHLLDHPILGGLMGRSPGLSFTARGLEIDASQTHPSGLEWLNGTPLVVDVVRGIHMRAIISHEGVSDPAGYDGYVHVGFRTNADPVSPEEAFFGLGIFGQGAGPAPFPGARTIGTLNVNSTYPQTASFDAGEAVQIAAHWTFREDGAGEKVTLKVDFWGLDFGYQETAEFDVTDPGLVQQFLDLHGMALYPCVQTYHPGTVTEPSIFIISEFCGH